MASILLRHIYKAYPHSKKEDKKEKEQQLSPFAVKDFNLEIQDGEFIVLVGPSGCGKSTTLRMIAGLEDISAGELYIDGNLSNNVDSSKRDIAMVFQNYALYPHMTSYQNMSYGLKLRKIKKPLLKKGEVVYDYDKEKAKELQRLIKKSQSAEEVESLKAQLEEVKSKKDVPVMKAVHYSKEEIDEKVKAAAEVLDITHLLDRKPSEMSGGQRQRVALGRALVRDPKVFLLDEPLSNLDAKLRASMRNEIVKLHKKVQTTFVYVTHDQIEAMTMGDRIVVMKDGVIQQVDTPSNIYDNPANLFVAGFIGTPQMNFFDAKLNSDARNLYLTLPDQSKISFKLSALKPIQTEYISGKEKDVVLGVRGEHIVIGNEGIPAVVSFAEILGNSTNILCKFEEGGEEFNITIQSRSDLKPGDKIKISFAGANIHLFNKETGASIYQLKEEKQ